MNRPFWAPSTVRPIFHLFYRVDELEQVAACGTGHLSATDPTDRRTDVPPNPCPNCKAVWDAWCSPGLQSTKSPHPPRPSDVSRALNRAASSKRDTGMLTPRQEQRRLRRAIESRNIIPHEPDTVSTEPDTV